jgi:DNA-binding MarR family transcriptional regulator
MDEPDYPPLTSAQKKIMRHIHDHGPAYRADLTRLIGMTKHKADDELSSLIIRGAVKTDPIDHDLFLLGLEAAEWMP